jgi:hypothetical protein
MNNLYRISETEMCETCLDKDRRVHELEMHDMDASDLKRKTADYLVRVIILGLMMVLLGGGTAMFGLWLCEYVRGTYGDILAGMVWLFGSFVVLNSIIVASKYYYEKNQLVNRLWDLRRLRHKQIRLLNDLRTEEKRKQKEALA